MLSQLLVVSPSGLSTSIKETQECYIYRYLDIKRLVLPIRSWASHIVTKMATNV